MRSLLTLTRSLQQLLAHDVATSVTNGLSGDHIAHPLRDRPTILRTRARRLPRLRVKVSVEKAVVAVAKDIGKKRIAAEGIVAVITSVHVTSSVVLEKTAVMERVEESVVALIVVVVKAAVVE